MEKLNVYLADLVGAHAKLQNMHWNVVGEHFKMVHEYTETIYRQLYEYIDSVAEYMVMNGKRPFASLKDFAENTTIAQLKSEEYKAGEVVRYSLAIVRALKESAHEIHGRNRMLSAPRFTGGANRIIQQAYMVLKQHDTTKP